MGGGGAKKALAAGDRLVGGAGGAGENVGLFYRCATCRGVQTALFLKIRHQSRSKTRITPLWGAPSGRTYSGD